MNDLSMLHESSLCFTGVATSQSQLQAERLHRLSSSSSCCHRLPTSNSMIRIDSAYQRRSRSEWNPLHKDQVLELLDLSLFKTEGTGLRPYPAAGAIYSVQVYLASYRVDDLDPGVYFVRWNERALEQIGTAKLAHEFLDGGILQKGKEQAPLIALLVMDTRLSSIKYHDRAYRFGLLEAGALIQTIYLAAESLGLSALALGGIADRAALRVCGIEWHEQIGFVCGIALGSRTP